MLPLTCLCCCWGRCMLLDDITAGVLQGLHRWIGRWSPLLPAAQQHRLQLQPTHPECSCVTCRSTPCPLRARNPPAVAARALFTPACPSLCLPALSLRLSRLQVLLLGLASRVSVGAPLKFQGASPAAVCLRARTHVLRSLAPASVAQPCPRLLALSAPAAARAHAGARVSAAAG